MKSILLSLASILAALLIPNQSFACDKDACMKKFRQYNVPRPKMITAAQKEQALAYLDLHDSCACAVMEHPVSVGYLAIAEQVVEKLRVYDGTKVDTSWISAGNKKASTRKASDATTKKEKERDEFIAMDKKISETKSFTDYVWRYYGGAAYEGRAHPCFKASGGDSLDAFIKEHDCVVDELHEKEGVAIVRCKSGNPYINEPLRLMGFYKTEKDCIRCYPRLSTDGRFRLRADPKNRCHKGWREKYGTKKE